ncbi:MAG: leucine-rich repeat domain-containing protein [Bergeyella zoohelcum]|nr:leucine-rich repeat domain-containing protein [Bergeyella zoohelcum]
MYEINFFKKVSVASTFAVAIFANAQEFQQNGINYQVIDTTANLVKVIASPDATGEVEIPIRVSDGGVTYTVALIGNSAFRSNLNITGITIPQTVQKIENNAFDGCKTLSSVVLPEGLEAIGDSTFDGCEELVRISIPASVTSIGRNVFLNCTKLVTINVDASNQNYMSDSGILFSKDKKVIYRFPTAKTLTEYTIPDSVETIELGAFEGARFSSVSIPNSVKIIKESAFLNCVRLYNVNIPDSVQEIGNMAFASCLNLREFNISASVTKIGDNVFTYCSNLVNINVNEGNAFYSSEDGVLFDRKKRILVYSPIGKRGAYSVPDGVIEIGRSAFANSNLTSVVFPATLKNFRRNAMFGAEKITEIFIHTNTPPTLERQVFDAMPVSSITLKVPVGAGATYKSTDVWRDFNIVEDATLSAQDASLKASDLSVYPNPVVNILNIKSDEKIGNVALYNSAGQVVKTFELNKGENKIDVSTLNKGVYFINLKGKVYKVLK